MINSFIAVLLSVSFMSVIAEARRDNRRENRQQGRIAEGVKNGELNRAEAHRLRRGQHRVDVAQDKAEADGVVTAKERIKLEKMQDVQSKRIYRQKHDEQKRQSATGPQQEPAPVETPAEQ